MRKLFVFDLDDTLLYNKHNYSKPMLEAIEVILDTLRHRAPYVPALMALVDQLDRDRIKEIDPTTGTPYLYNRRRFPGSLVAVYEKVCLDAGVTPEDEVREELLAVGEKAFAPEQYQHNIVPDAKRVLDFLDRQGHLMVLCTKGDPEVQRDKLDVLESRRILGHFTNVSVVGQKDSAMFAHIKDIYPHCPGGAYSVGNMYKGDIVPALEVGYKGVYIPDEHWETQGDKTNALRDVDPTKVLVLEELSQFIDRYQDLP